ncbi:MAG: glycosyl hydrolase [Bacteroidetes bacterium]|nr:glycosyl hydrolase [Bacteroidota bacterium]MBS1632239.1 glycosyl hydrolase [Bacteroidota bacterium]
MRKILFILFAVSFFSVSAQRKKQNQAPAKPTASVNTDSIFYSKTDFRLIGPFRGGRSAAVAGSYKDRNTFYFGATGGGVWKTTDGGNNWKNISDKYYGGSIGAVAVAPSDDEVIYVGEGENTMRGNVSEGLGGMWRSDDGGKTWTDIGLRDGRHIIRIVIHPKNPDIVWVAVMGHLFGPNQERGVYKTTDGGKNWKRVLFVNDQTGCSDLVMEPGNPKVFYAGMWRLIRTPYSLESGGEGSGLWKSTDGGETWKNITANKGLPKGTWGIVGVAVAPSNTDKIYSIIENKDGGVFMSADAGETWTLTSNDNNVRQRAWYYTKIFVDPKNENRVYCPNVGFMRSNDGGRTFQGMQTPHGDHHDLWIDPEDPNRMIVADDGGGQVSFNGGASWSTYLNQPTVQTYRVSTDNAFPYRVLAPQQDNGAFRIKSRTYGFGITAEDMEEAAGSESGYIVADPLNPDITYGGNYQGLLQRLDHRTGESRMINVWPIDNMGAGAEAAKYRFQWNYPIFFSPNNPRKLYAAGNHLFATEDEGKTWQMISPDLTTNDKSKQASSGGPITQDNTSVEYYCTIFYATESWLEKDLLWTGSDDGVVSVSKDGGKNWENVTPKDAPKWMMWNCIEVDPFKKGAAYFVGTRYKLDDFKSYIYKTEDYGKTWKLIVNGIDPMHFARCLRADRKRPGLLYAGTEYGMYISYDDGANWKPFQLNLPIVPIVDLAIKNNDLIVGTQGRSLYILDDLTVLQEKNNDVLNKNLHVFSVNPAYRMPGGGRFSFRGFGGGTLANVGMNPPNGVVFNYYMKNANDSTKLSIAIMDKNKKKIKTFSTTARGGGAGGGMGGGRFGAAQSEKIDVVNGMNQFEWDMNYPQAERVDGLILWNGFIGGPKAAPGNYFAEFKSGSDSVEVPFTIVADPNYKTSQAEYDEQFNFLITLRDKSSEVMKAIKNIRDVRQQMNEFSGRVGRGMPKEVKHEMDTINKQMTAVEEALHQTKAKSSQDVLNFPIRLDDKLSSIYNAASAGSSGLSQQAKDAYTELEPLINVQLNKLKKIMSDDVSKLNQMIHEKSLPVIGVKKD